MSKKFKNIENDEEFKKFKLQDYLPSMPNADRVEKSADVKSEVAAETSSLFPPMEEPDTSTVQMVMSAAIPREQVECEASDDETAGTSTMVDDVPTERTIVRRISSKQRRLSLDEYRDTYLQVPKIIDRKPVFVSSEVRDELDRIVRCLGGRGMSVSGLVENLARHHLSTYGNDIEQWRKL